MPNPATYESLLRLRGALDALSADLDGLLARMGAQPAWLEPEAGKPACPRCQGAGCQACGSTGTMKPREGDRLLAHSIGEHLGNPRRDCAACWAEGSVQ